MAVSNELSSEIAAALLANPNRSARELEALMEMIFRVHSVLSQMDEEARAERMRSIAKDSAE